MSTPPCLAWNRSPLVSCVASQEKADRPGLHGDIFFERHGDSPATCRAVKIVMAPEDGLDVMRRPHNVVREVRVLRAAAHPNVSPGAGKRFASSAKLMLDHSPA